VVDNVDESVALRTKYGVECQVYAPLKYTPESMKTLLELLTGTTGVQAFRII
jgi:hypothetical protein